MPLEYVNYKKNTYFIHERELKSGKVGYYCNKESADGLNELPEGHELYESPNGQVFCRKIQKKLITDEEVDLVRRLIKEHCKSSVIRIDVKKNIISIWELDGGTYSSYSPSLRYTLNDKKSRTFYVERFCYRGSIDDWIELFEIKGNTLEELARETIVHLGQESFFDLS